MKYLLLLISMFIFSCSPPTSNEDIITETYPNVQEEIKELVQNIFDDGAAKKLEELDAYHLNSPKFTRVAKNGLLTYEEGKAREEAFYGNYDITHFEIIEHKVDVYGDIAISSFFFDMTANLDSDTIHRKSMASLTFVNQNGSWKIIHENISPRE